MSKFPEDGAFQRPFPERIVIVTDAWLPQTNGVVRTLTATCEMLRDWGHTVDVISPDQFLSVPCPTYPEIRLALPRPGAVAGRISDLSPDAVHIATEGPLGLAARNFCVAVDFPFTTAYHTQFPEYLARRTPFSAQTFWRYITWFHRPAERIMVATESIRAQLRKNGLTNLHHWGRGVDLSCFTPDAVAPREFADLPHPIQLYVGRVSVEKNLEAFLANPYPGSKVVVGDGPARAALEAAFPDAHFLGRKTGRDLAGCYAGADVFVFPSKTDTFGLVMIEALACGTPVAAYPVAGPIDIVTEATGALSDQLERAIAAAVFSNGKDCVKHGSSFGWETATGQFLSGLVATNEDLVPVG
ncbi:glycosyltransferase [Altererythrobacter aquaemixtae]|uniref:Glycosyltransferase n=2 Tax=Pontixanthobacter aquaemixtae TaxID=1958940 RepID=A0A844ZW27_9SPHN|nr:glycosyltransferase family 1 protein [Pontixanthobacter aquaemixtae]MXO91380.1 glycosyltransferase [Pontixanthobacter aquaemixtae]